MREGSISKLICSFTFLSLVLIPIQCNIDIFHLYEKNVTDVVFQGEIDPRFRVEEFHQYCPRNPIFVFENQKDIEFMIAPFENGTVVVTDILNGGESISYRVVEHSPKNITINGQCNIQDNGKNEGWGKKTIRFTFTPDVRDPNSGDELVGKKGEYLVRYNINCKPQNRYFDYGLVLLVVAAILITCFASIMKKPSGAISKSLITEDTSLNLKTVTIWFIVFSFVMVLVSYFELYMDLSLRLFYTLLGLFTTHVVFEDIFYLISKTFLNQKVYKRMSYY